VSSQSTNFERSPESIFVDLQKGIVSAGHTIKSAVPNQSIITEGGRDYNGILMVVLILFLWPGAIIYYFTTQRSSLSVIVTKHNETGTTVTINSNGKAGDKITEYLFLHIHKHEEEPEKSLQEYKKKDAAQKQDDTQFWVCPNCGGNTQLKDGRQYCSACKIYLSI